MKKWTKRVSTGVLKWRPRSEYYGYLNLLDGGHMGFITIEYWYDGYMANRRVLYNVNLTKAQVEGVPR